MQSALSYNKASLHYSESLPPVWRAAMIGGVVLLHLVGIWALLQISAVRDAVAQAAPIFVQWVAPPAPPEITPPPEVPPPPKPKPVPVVKKAPPVVVAPAVPETPAVEFVAPEPVQVAPEPVQHVEPVAPPPLAPIVAATPKTIPASAVRYREAPKPAYPALSKRLNEEGRAVIRVLIDPQGKAQEMALAESSGYARLDEAAMAAVKRALFYPYTENGVAMAVWVQIPIAFGLNR